jgi:receptor protein-tyrosine kinase/non-specific protein-tyrosine kinase
MSRIEKAMGKAAQLRQGVGSMPVDRQQVPIIITEHYTPPKLESATVRIAPLNRLLVNLNDPYSPIAEEYRKLKAILVKMTKGDDFFKNTLMVTSAVPHEGKSVTALNLAISLAQEFDHTVLLVDADLRRPSLQSYLDIECTLGFSDCLRGTADIGDTIIATGIGRLSVIPAGREIANPAEFFTSQKMKSLIEEMKYRYHDRYIIFDTPPLLPFAETRSLAHLVDGVLFVVKERLASHNNVKEALEYLKGCEILGIVYNDATVDHNDERYSSYKSYFAKS